MLAGADVRPQTSGDTRQRYGYGVLGIKSTVPSATSATQYHVPIRSHQGARRTEFGRQWLQYLCRAGHRIDVPAFVRVVLSIPPHIKRLFTERLTSTREHEYLDKDVADRGFEETCLTGSAIRNESQSVHSGNVERCNIIPQSLRTLTLEGYANRKSLSWRTTGL